MAPQSQFPNRLASEEVIINAPLSYAGSAQRIIRIRRRAPAGWQLGALTLLAIVLVALVWVFVTAWYLTWGLFLVPYRLLRRGARKRNADALRHRELLGTIQGPAAASAGAIVAASTAFYAQAGSGAPAAVSPSELVADADRERIIDELREHMLLGRLIAEEFEARLDAAHRARTCAELDKVRADLPSRPTVGPASGR